MRTARNDREDIKGELAKSNAELEKMKAELVKATKQLADGKHSKDRVERISAV